MKIPYIQKKEKFSVSITIKKFKGGYISATLSYGLVPESHNHDYAMRGARGDLYINTEEFKHLLDRIKPDTLKIEPGVDIEELSRRTKVIFKWYKSKFPSHYYGNAFYTYTTLGE